MLKQIIVASVWSEDKVEWDDPISVLRDGTVSFLIWLRAVPVLFLV